MNAEIHLRIAGALLLALAAMHMFLPRQLDWKNDMAKVSLANRQIFFVHVFFIALFVTLTGILSLCFAPALLEKTMLSRVVLVGLIVFWAARFVTQIIIYDSRIWRGDRARTMVYYGFAGFCAYLVFAYSNALARVLNA